MSRAEDAARSADHQAAGLLHQRGRRQALEFPPQFEGSPHHRYVKRILKVSLADDPAVPMRRAKGMGRNEAIEADDVESAARAFEGGRAAHRAQANDRYVVR